MPSRKKTSTVKSLSSPSQQLALKLRQNWGLERTPGECQETLRKAVNLFRSILKKGNKHLPPYEYNAFRVIAALNAGLGVYEAPNPEGGVALSLYEDGRDWAYETGKL